MDKHPIVTVLLEIAGSAFVLYSQVHPDANIAAALWFAVWKTAQTVARAAGTIAMRAELRYFQTVKI